MKQLITDFDNVCNLSIFAEFVKKYALENTKDYPNDMNIVNVHKGVLNGHNIVVTYRWRDRCKVNQIRPDGNDIELEIFNQEGAAIYKKNVSFLDS